ncbi:MAG: hypothetical protein IRY97_05410 [Thermomicrobiaceae bacterium]|nr:hypothetical protein [Thermomicrobiaceae bacterium]
MSQAAQARQLEEARVRQQITDLSARIDDTARPIRSLQAHVAELVEAVRRQRDDGGFDVKKFDELRALIDHLAAHGERQAVVSQSLRDSIDAVRHEVDRIQRDVLRTDDGVKIVEQELRRRVAEIVQQIDNQRARLDEEVPRFDALQAQIDELREALAAFDPQFEGVRAAHGRLEGEIARFHAQAVERDEITAERVEEIRQHFDTQVRDTRQIAEQRHERLVQRLDQFEEADRDLAYRIKMLEMQIEELRQIDQRLRREVWYLHEQRARLRFEQAQHELESIIEQRREAERQDEPDGRGPRRQD